MPVLSTRNSTLPALISLIAWATFGVTVPVFGFRSETLRRERHLPDRRVNNAGLVDAELHLAGLDLLDRLGDVRSHRAGLRVPIGDSASGTTSSRPARE